MLQGRNAAGKKNNSVDRIANRDQQTVSQVAWWRGVVDFNIKDENTRERSDNRMLTHA